MNIRIERSFERDVNKIKDIKLLKKLRDIISAIERAQSILEIPHTKKIKGYISIFSAEMRNSTLSCKSIPH